MPARENGQPQIAVPLNVASELTATRVAVEGKLQRWTQDLQQQLQRASKRVALEQQRGDLLKAQSDLLRARLLQPAPREDQQDAAVQTSLEERLPAQATGDVPGCMPDLGRWRFGRRQDPLTDARVVDLVRQLTAEQEQREAQTAGLQQQQTDMREQYEGHIAELVRAREALEVRANEDRVLLNERLSALEARRQQATDRAGDLEQRLGALEQTERGEATAAEREANLRRRLSQMETSVRGLEGKLATATEELEQHRLQLKERDVELRTTQQERDDARREAAEQASAAKLQDARGPPAPPTRRRPTSKDAAAAARADSLERGTQLPGQQSVAVPAFFDGIAENDAAAVRRALRCDATGGLLGVVDPKTGNGPLHHAVVHGSADAAAVLMETTLQVQERQAHELEIRSELQSRSLRRAVDGPNAAGRSPLAELVRQASPSEELTVKLLGAKADLSRRDACGMTPFLECAEVGHVNLVKVLASASRGAVMNDADDAGRTPLHCAASAGRQEVAGLLLRMKVNPNSSDFEGRTAIEVAKAAGHSDLAEMLLGATTPPWARPGPGQGPSAAGGGKPEAAWGEHTGAKDNEWQGKKPNKEEEEEDDEQSGEEDEEEGIRFAL